MNTHRVLMFLFIFYLFSCEKQSEFVLPEGVAELSMDELALSMSAEDKASLVHDPLLLQLASNVWVLNLYTLDDGSQHTVLDGTQYTLTVNLDDLLIQGTLDCNHYKAIPKIEGFTLSFKYLAMTKNTCFKNPELQTASLRQNENISNFWLDMLEIEIIEDTMLLYDENGNFLSFISSKSSNTET